MIEKRRPDVSTPSKTFYVLSFLVNLFSNVEIRQFGVSGSNGLSRELKNKYLKLVNLSLLLNEILETFFLLLNFSPPVQKSIFFFFHDIWSRVRKAKKKFELNHTQMVEDTIYVTFPLIVTRQSRRRTVLIGCFRPTCHREVNYFIY